MYFSGRISAYEHCINNILELKNKYNILFFCALNCDELTDYERNFISLCAMSDEQYVYKKIKPEEWVYQLNCGYHNVNRDNVYSHFYNNKKCIELIEKYEETHNIKFDCIIKYRADICSTVSLDLDKYIESNVLYMPDTAIYFGMNDQIGYGNCEIMKIYSRVFENILHLCLHKQVIYHPESILYAHIKENNINIKTFKFDYYLHNARTI